MKNKQEKNMVLNKKMRLYGFHFLEIGMNP
jgi:hypothetical protein